MADQFPWTSTPRHRVLLFRLCLGPGQGLCRSDPLQRTAVAPLPRPACCLEPRELARLVPASTCLHTACTIRRSVGRLPHLPVSGPRIGGADCWPRATPWPSVGGWPSSR